MGHCKLDSARTSLDTPNYRRAERFKLPTVLYKLVNHIYFVYLAEWCQWTWYFHTQRKCPDSARRHVALSPHLQTSQYAISASGKWRDRGVFWLSHNTICPTKHLMLVLQIWTDKLEVHMNKQLKRGDLKLSTIDDPGIFGRDLDRRCRKRDTRNARWRSGHKNPGFLKFRVSSG